jgi:SAM-dependent methyltransferase
VAPARVSVVDASRRRRLRNPLELPGVLQRRYILRVAGRLGLVAYVPSWEHRAQLERLTTYTEDRRPIRDKRPTTRAGEIPDLTLTVDGLEDVLRDVALERPRVLEVGPKYGIHSLWLDEHVDPAELVFSDFAADTELHERWAAELRCPHHFVYGDLRTAGELLELEPFDLVLFLGVLYHTSYHVPLLAMLNRVTRLGGTMLLETTVDARPDASVRIRWSENTKAKAVPSLDAVRVMLAWTGWRDATRFTDYRPGSSEMLLRCVKTDELAEGSDFADVVRPHRRPAV